MKQIYVTLREKLVETRENAKLKIQSEKETLFLILSLSYNRLYDTRLLIPQPV